ncbi:hypothetical protein QL989_16325 [Pseudoalteromonas sp. APC 3224]|uniref:hypothetical protein n=1 Tax=Pseudoalteromonas sp. APC 3224 TaxID=3035203 RepID=UPI0025B4F555|nr:hypothetical protein [Pseudoalteromonas sp. APC 3224]MDN3486906.1 hypothetical protein [Pseudoalteromonas sp. APC 3224]
MEFIKRVIGYVLFIPLIYFYSFILGPILKAVLVPGGVTFLWLILGPQEGTRALKKHLRKSSKIFSKTNKKPCYFAGL